MEFISNVSKTVSVCIIRADVKGEAARCGIYDSLFTATIMMKTVSKMLHMNSTFMCPII
jgi:hypothetical protein